MGKFKGNGYYYIKLIEDAHNETSNHKREHFTIRAGDTVIAAIKKTTNGLAASISNPADPYSVYKLTKYNFSGCYPEFSIVDAVAPAPVRKKTNPDKATEAQP